MSFWHFPITQNLRSNSLRVFFNKEGFDFHRWISGVGQILSLIFINRFDFFLYDESIILGLFFDLVRHVS